MSEQLRESLSAVMDGEADELELQRVLSHAHDPQLRQLWARYHVVRQVCRDGERTSVNFSMDISMRVQQAIAREPVRYSLGFISARIGKLAVAASVTAAVLLGAQMYQPSRGPDPVAAVASVSPVGRVNGVGAAPLSAGFGQGDSANSSAQYNQLARQRLQYFMLQHVEQASLNTPQGMMPFARVVTVEAQ